eukprot:TRINITY_DN6304_c0_g1_i1.p3 TRINITY_DN6304_c0_g1~~TRINITY_DN6304_c0_g1_i1.p3  ORF type:complete len:126 (+),score=69.97 TRINITY_DN6304_c0_g1_i1:184-561(+)
MFRVASSVLRAAPRVILNRAAVLPRLAVAFPRVTVRNYETASHLEQSAIESRVIDIVKNYSKIDGSKVTAASHFINDLGVDSLDVVEIVLALEDEFAVEIPDDVADNVQSIADAIKYLSDNPYIK